MRIGIILHPYGEEKPGGLARIILEWTKALIEFAPQHEYIVFLKEKPVVAPDLPGNNWKIHMLGPGYFWLDRLRRAPQADVYIFNTPILPLWYCPPRSIVIALDFAYKHFKPESFKALLLRFFIGWYHARSLKKADRIVAISESTKRDAIKFFAVPEKKIAVVYPGFKKICESTEISIGVPERFFLFVGVIKERKNVLNIVKAYDQLRARHPDTDYKFVIVGRGGGIYANRVKQYVRSRQLEDYVLFFGHVADGELSFLYKRAAAFVFPSFVEGFGFPILEAMHCGCPVITSNVSSTEELGRNGAALLVNPHKSAEIAQAMGQITADPKFRERLIEIGKKRTQEYSWEHAAREILSVISKL